MTRYVPGAYETVGWGLIFLLSLALDAHWGATDEAAREELDGRIDGIHTVGYTFGKIFASPGWRYSAGEYSRQYQEGEEGV